MGRAILWDRRKALFDLHNKPRKPLTLWWRECAFSAFGLEIVTKSPVANVGVDQTVLVSETVILDGSGSTDPDGDPLTYLWTQTGGTPVALNDDSAASPTFTAPPSATVLTFMHIVTDTGGLADTDTVNVTVNSTMASLVADDDTCSVENLSLRYPLETIGSAPSMACLVIKPNWDEIAIWTAQRSYHELGSP